MVRQRTICTTIRRLAKGSFLLCKLSKLERSRKREYTTEISDCLKQYVCQELQCKLVRNTVFHELSLKEIENMSVNLQIKEALLG